MRLGFLVWGPLLPLFFTVIMHLLPRSFVANSFRRKAQSSAFVMFISGYKYCPVTRTRTGEYTLH